jgi:hypothetical protein
MIVGWRERIETEDRSRDQRLARHLRGIPI